MSLKKIVISGANRGIGLGLCDFFAEQGHDVVATTRDLAKARELQELKLKYPKHVTIEVLDVRSDDSAEALANAVRNKWGVCDILINNAGVLIERDRSFQNLTFEGIEESFSVNAVSAMRITRVLLDCIAKSRQPVVANMSSLMGSVADNRGGGAYGYRMSKAALNMFNMSFAVDYPKITSVVLHPGWVKTDMGGSNAPTSVPESTSGLGRVILGLQPGDTGKFLDFRGDELPW